MFATAEEEEADRDVAAMILGEVESSGDEGETAALLLKYCDATTWVAEEEEE
eukprot:COSAG01_NODE_6582_length_3595_cov_1.812071_2_plen_52_part_00